MPPIQYHQRKFLTQQFSVNILIKPTPKTLKYYLQYSRKVIIFFQLDVRVLRKMNWLMKGAVSALNTFSKMTIFKWNRLIVVVKRFG